MKILRIVFYIYTVVYLPFFFWMIYLQYIHPFPASVFVNVADVFGTWTMYIFSVPTLILFVLTSVCAWNIRGLYRQRALAAFSITLLAIVMSVVMIVGSIVQHFFPRVSTNTVDFQTLLEENDIQLIQ